MKSEDKFKEKLNELLDSKEFTFDDESWRGAARLLDADRARRRGGFGLFLSGILMIITGTVLSFDNAPAITERMPSDAPRTTISAPASGKSEAAPAAEPVYASNTLLTADIPTDLPEKSNATSSESSEQRADKPASGGHHTGTPRQNDARPIVAPDVENSAPATQEMAGTNSPAADAEKNRPGTETAPDPAPEKLTPDAEPAIDPNEPAMLLRPVFLSLKFTPSTPQMRLPAMTLPPALPEKHLMMSFEAGISALTGWKSQSGSEGAGMNVTAGFNYYTPLSETYYFSAGVHYNAIGNLSLDGKVSRVTRYKLGEENDVTVITPSRIHYITLPLRLNTFFTHRDMFYGGVNFSYMLNADANVEEYTERLGRRENYRTFKASGYVDGISWYDLQLSLGYRRRIHRDLTAGAEFMFGLSDIKEDYFFRNNNFERLMGLKIVLQYNIFRTH